MAVEYIRDGNIIRSTNQIEMEEAIMNKNTQFFQLSYVYLIFYKDILLLIGSCSQNQVAQMIISNNTELQSSNKELNIFISLLYKDN